MAAQDAFDLHVHTRHSDGLHTPDEVVAAAAAAGLAGLALTDHDTGTGVPAARAAAQTHGIELIAGTEFSAEADGLSVHVLAYWVDHDEPALAAELDRLRDERMDRARRMVARLRDLGAGIEVAQVLALADGAPVGRPHVAQALVASGFVRDQREAFDRYLGDGGPAYVMKHAVDPVRAVELLRGAGGVVVLAHPGLHGGRDGLTEVPLAIVAAMRDAGLAGLEADHVGHDAGTRDRWRAHAQRLGLAVTGGSDHHGGDRDAPIGAAVTPRAVVEGLRSLR